VTDNSLAPRGLHRREELFVVVVCEVRSPLTRPNAGPFAEVVLSPAPQIHPQWLAHHHPISNTSKMGRIDGAEVAKHNDKSSCWIVLDSKAYDVTSFMHEHPGGAPIILRNAGTVRLQEHHTGHGLKCIGCDRGVQKVPPTGLPE